MSEKGERERGGCKGSVKKERERDKERKKMTERGERERGGGREGKK